MHPRLTGVTCTQSGVLGMHSKHTLFLTLPTNTFIKSPPFTPFGSLHSPSSLGAESHIPHAAFSYSQCKNLKGNKIHQSSTWLIKTLSHCSAFPVALQLKLLAFYLQGSLILQLSIWMAMGKSHHNLPNPWSLFLVPAKNLCSLLWSLLPLLKQQKTFYKVTYIPPVRCSLTYDENHGIA